MESIAARAFKSSCFPSDIAPTTKAANPQPLPLGEDYFLDGDDFSIDEFFDLERLSEVQDKTSSSSSSSTSSLSSQDQFDEGSSFSATGLSASLPAADGLAIPVDHTMKELELWSNLMDDTLCDDVFPCPPRLVYLKTGSTLEKRVRFEPEAKPATVETARFPAPKPVKPRSKRLRTGSSGAWPTCSLLKTGYSSPSSSEPRSELEKTGAGPTKGRKPGVKKPKRKPAVSEDGSLTGPVQQRKCTHCQVQKTPQWRTGPFGPKTLCNACGVRFKSGRLFPEYRPACSPEFTSEIHSNSHRKVVEMRKRKMSEPTGPDFAPTILSC